MGRCRRRSRLGLRGGTSDMVQTRQVGGGVQGLALAQLKANPQLEGDPVKAFLLFLCLDLLLGLDGEEGEKRSGLETL